MGYVSAVAQQTSSSRLRHACSPPLTVCPPSLLPDLILELSLFLGRLERVLELCRILGILVSRLVILGQQAITVAVNEQHGSNLIQVQVL